MDRKWIQRMRNFLLPSIFGLALANVCARAAAQQPAESGQLPRVVIRQGTAPTIHDDCPSLPNAHLIDLSCSEAAALVDKLKKAQDALKKGKPPYFELLSGAIASDPMARISPRDAFMKMPFGQSFIVEREKTDTRLWKPYKFTYKPAGAGPMIWQIEVALGFNDELLRVQMFYGQAPPF